MLAHEVRKVFSRVVDITCVIGTDDMARCVLADHMELRVKTKMHVRHCEVLFKERELLLEIRESDLDIEDHDTVRNLRRNRERLIDFRVRHAEHVVAFPAWSALCGYSDVINRRNRRSGRVCRLPFFLLTLKHGEHLRLGVLAKHTHLR